MLGSHTMPLSPIIDRIEAVPYVTTQQKRGICCDHAARFPGLAATVWSSPASRAVGREP
jgi:hypothetical protein